MFKICIKVVKTGPGKKKKQTLTQLLYENNQSLQKLLPKLNHVTVVPPGGVNVVADH